MRYTEKMGEIRKLYLSKFIYGFGCMASYTFTLYFLGSGLSQAQIGILFAIYFVATVILEIPTGGFADIFGHKASFSLGIIIESFYYLIFFLFPSFWGFVAGMLIAALGLSLQSGANDSLTYEIVNRLGKKDEYIKISGKISAMMSLAVIIAAPIGTLLYAYNQGVPYLLSFGLVFLAGIVVYFVKFDFRHVQPTMVNYLTQIRTGLRIAMNNPRLLVLFLVGLVTVTSSYVFSENIMIPLQLNLGINIGMLGITQSMIAVGYLLVNYFSYRLVTKFGSITSLAFSLLASSLFMFILSKINYLYGASFIVLFFMTHGLRCNVLDNLQQQEATSAQRSTIASAGNVMKSLGAAVMLPLWGMMIDNSGISNTLVALSIFVMTFGLLGVWIYSKLKEVNNPHYTS
jgi:MFS family permease